MGDLIAKLYRVCLAGQGVGKYLRRWGTAVPAAGRAGHRSPSAVRVGCRTPRCRRTGPVRRRGG
ncbi:hypothetical protein [Streptomyces sp. NPDC059872]|uniref:hypothetical protein n=1 Tax=Streptomyces sp. NPDC059872 TaxID=3346981 RepID=UPI00365FA421